MSNYKHGKSNTKEYIAWINMRARCYSESDINFKNYGGRGIKVCDSWRESFENFLTDMGEAPTKEHSVDRIDVNGNYDPTNCRWASRKQQMRNRTDSVRIKILIELHLEEWCSRFGLCSRTFYTYRKEGLTNKEAMLALLYKRSTGKRSLFKHERHLTNKEIKDVISYLQDQI